MGDPALAEYRGGEFREARDLDQVHVVLGFPSVGYTHPDFYADDDALHPARRRHVLAPVPGGAGEARPGLFGLFLHRARSTDGGLFGIYAGTGESEAEELMPVTLEELRRVQHDVTEVELHRARAQAKAGILMSLESTGSRCEQLARQIQIFGRIVPVKEMVAKIEAVRTEDVCRAAAHLFRAKPTLAVLGPAGKVPGLTTIAEKLAA